MDLNQPPVAERSLPALVAYRPEVPFSSNNGSIKNWDFSHLFTSMCAGWEFPMVLPCFSRVTPKAQKCQLMLLGHWTEISINNWSWSVNEGNMPKILWRYPLLIREGRVNRLWLKVIMTEKWNHFMLKSCAGHFPVCSQIYSPLFLCSVL